MTDNSKILYFASSNENKFQEIKCLIPKENNLKIEFFKIDVKEIQSESIMEVAEDKARKAYNFIKNPLIIEDDGLFITGLNGFPGVYSSFVFKTIGNQGILKLLEKNKNREAKFVSVFSFFNGKIIKSFTGENIGSISLEIESGGWGFDPIFKPENELRTYSQLGMQDKIKISHRTKALKKFLHWYFKEYDNSSMTFV